MPNWCENELTIVGDEAELEVLEATLRGRDDEGEETPISFASLDPTPAELDTLPYGETDEGRQVLARFEALREDDPAAAADFLAENPAIPVLRLERDSPLRTRPGGWSAWNVQHWGTDRNAAFATVEREPGYLRYWFSTASSPAVPFVRTLAVRYPSLTATLVWAEAGNILAGVAHFEKGELAWRRDEEFGTDIIALLEEHKPEWADWFREGDEA